MSDFTTLWAVAYQAPLSMGFYKQEYWTGLPFPSLGELPDPGIKPVSLVSPALAASSLPLGPPPPPGEALPVQLLQDVSRIGTQDDQSFRHGVNASLIFHQLSPHTQKVKMSQNSTKVKLHATQTEKTSPIPVPCQPGCSSVPV